MSKETEKIWTKKCRVLIGKKIVNVRYLTKKEMEYLGWYSKSLVIFFDDGTYIYPSQDDEGNDGGSLFTNIKGLLTIPVIYESN